MDGAQSHCDNRNDLPLRAHFAAKRAPLRDLPAATFELALPLIEGGCVLLAAALADLLLVATVVQQAAEPTWNTHLRWSASAAVIAPIMLRWQPQPTVAVPGSALRAFAPRFAAFVAIVLLIGLVDGSLATIAPIWLLLWLGLSLLLLLLLRAHLVPPPRRETIAVVGAGPIADLLVSALKTRAHAPVDLLGVFDDRGPREQVDLQRRGSIADLLEIGKREPIDTILLALPGAAVQRVSDMVHDLKALAVPVGLCPADLLGRCSAQGAVAYAARSLPYALLADRPIQRSGLLIKAVEDYVLASVALLLLAPLLALIAVAVRISGPGPILFRQPRHAWNNGEFQVFKFRTMRWDPQARSRAMVQTQVDDARITAVGRFLRCSSLDELPQLLNVLRGEMSLVGPRPHALDMRTDNLLGNQIIRSYAHRHRVKPGITGLAQVNGYRGATHTVEALRRRVEYDLDYIDHWSLWLDLKILARTVWIVLRGTNAY